MAELRVSNGTFAEADAPEDAELYSAEVVA